MDRRIEFEEPFELSSWWTRFGNRFLRWGISGYPHVERRRLAITNLASGLAATSCVGYAISFSMFDYQVLGWAVWINLICAGLYLMTPWWHRWGMLAAATYLTIIAFGSLMWFSSRFGVESGTHLNFLTGIAIATVIFGNRIFWLLPVIGIGWGCHVWAHFHFQQPMFDAAKFDWLLRTMYLNAATTFAIVVGLVVWYAFRIAAEAEARTEELLKNMLPDQIALRLKRDPTQPIADRFAEASVMFADLVGFTPIFGNMEPGKMVGLLNEIFCRFDDLSQQFGVEKIKTIGDAYLVVAGAPVPSESHAVDLIGLAEAMLKTIEELEQKYRLGLNIRIGIATGPITAGVIGRAKFAYDVWAPTVNLASRLESHGAVGRIHVTEETRRAANEVYEFQQAETRDLKGIGLRRTWFVTGRR